MCACVCVCVCVCMYLLKDFLQSRRRFGVNETLEYRDVGRYIVKSCIIHRTSCIIHHTSYTVHHTSYITHHTPHIIHHTSYIIHHTSYILHHTSYIIHHTSYIVYHTSYMVHHAYTYTQLWQKKHNKYLRTRSLSAESKANASKHNTYNNSYVVYCMMCDA